MRYGLFSDVHSNQEAFRAVLDAFKTERIDKYVFLGDIVGYGANPCECIGMLKELISDPGCICVAGNHDYAVCGLNTDDRYTRHAREAVFWTKTKLSKADKVFLAQMDLVKETEDMTCMHANLEDPESWAYILDIDDAFMNFKRLRTQVGFFGHSHKPMVFKAGQMVDWSVEDRVVLREGMKFMVNVGSVGQPRDGDPRAAFAVFDTDSGIIEIRRVEYDIAAAQDKILKAGLPAWLAQRLGAGK